jgi:hypothetical protein
MSRKLQFGIWLAVGIGVMMAFPAAAQNRPPKPKQEQRQEQRREQRQAPRQERQQERRNERNQGNPNRPPTTQQNVTPNANRPPERAHNGQDRPPSAYTPPARNFNNLSPQEKQRTLQNYQNYQKLNPGQRQQMQESARNWNQLTPQQKNHVKNEVLPKWQQLPPQRQRAIQQRLGVLKNMPESARNQHLADPNFTRGMSEDDKSMLRDLSHLHVGGAPEEPHE